MDTINKQYERRLKQNGWSRKYVIIPCLIIDLLGALYFINDPNQSLFYMWIMLGCFQLISLIANLELDKIYRKVLGHLKK